MYKSMRHLIEKKHIWARNLIIHEKDKSPNLVQSGLHIFYKK